jgi:hypothetical protein
MIDSLPISLLVGLLVFLVISILHKKSEDHYDQQIDQLQKQIDELKK